MQFQIDKVQYIYKFYISDLNLYPKKNFILFLKKQNDSEFRTSGSRLSIGYRSASPDFFIYTHLKPYSNTPNSHSFRRAETASYLVRDLRWTLLLIPISTNCVQVSITCSRRNSIDFVHEIASSSVVFRNYAASKFRNCVFSIELVYALHIEIFPVCGVTFIIDRWISPTWLVALPFISNFELGGRDDSEWWTEDAIYYWKSAFISWFEKF